jgi:hypothetical protein
MVVQQVRAQLEVVGFNALVEMPYNDPTVAVHGEEASFPDDWPEENLLHLSITERVVLFEMCAYEVGAELAVVWKLMVAFWEWAGAARVWEEFRPTEVFENERSFF